ncbi:hypothetical protein EDD22DRAFT_843877 [Suillus occidentalis]|nr:hypothetical protein EDD22DRAFT_843877 [Suillus occidentalis]
MSKLGILVNDDGGGCVQQEGGLVDVEGGLDVLWIGRDWSDSDSSHGHDHRPDSTPTQRHEVPQLHIRMYFWNPAIHGPLHYPRRSQQGVWRASRRFVVSTYTLVFCATSTSTGDPLVLHARYMASMGRKININALVPPARHMVYFLLTPNNSELQWDAKCIEHKNPKIKTQNGLNPKIKTQNRFGCKPLSTLSASASPQSVVLARILASSSTPAHVNSILSVCRHEMRGVLLIGAKRLKEPSLGLDIGPVVQALLGSIPFAPQYSVPAGSGVASSQSVCLLGTKRLKEPRGSARTSPPRFNKINVNTGDKNTRKQNKKHFGEDNGFSRLENGEWVCGGDLHPDITIQSKTRLRTGLETGVYKMVQELSCVTVTLGTHEKKTLPTRPQLLQQQTQSKCMIVGGNLGLPYALHSDVINQSQIRLCTGLETTVYRMVRGLSLSLLDQRDHHMNHQLFSTYQLFLTFKPELNNPHHRGRMRRRPNQLKPQSSLAASAADTSAAKAEMATIKAKRIVCEDPTRNPLVMATIYVVKQARAWNLKQFVYRRFGVE